MITEQQRLERRNYIGASETAAVLGLSRWGTPLEVWGIKTGNIEPKDLSDHLPVILGNRLEEVVAELFTAKTGKKLRRVNETFYHPEYKFLACNIDRRIVGEETLVECKTASSWKAKEWAGEEVPQEYLIQVQQMLSVTGYKKAYLAVLIGNTDFIVKEVVRDDQIIRDMTKKLVHFWQTYVETKTMPAYITSHDADTLYSLYPMENSGTEIELGDELDRLAENRTAMLQEKKALESSLDQVDNQIKALMLDMESARGNTYIATWKRQTTNRFDSKRLELEKPEIYSEYLKQTPSRVLRIKALKE